MLEFLRPSADLCHLLFLLIYRCISLRQTISHGPFSLMQPFPPNTGTGHLAALNLFSRLQAGLTGDFGICAHARATPSPQFLSWSSASQKHYCYILYRRLPLHGKRHISVSYVHFSIPDTHGVCMKCMIKKYPTLWG